MLKYLIIQLDDASASFCHYHNDRTQNKLIPLEILRDAILWSMKENLTLQFLYPDYVIPEDYKREISKTFHADIVASTCNDTKLRENADVVVFDSLAAVNYDYINLNQTFVVRSSLSVLLESLELLITMLSSTNRLNIVITDIKASTATRENLTKYSNLLDSLAYQVAEEYKSGHNVQLNLLTDRMLLNEMNNCNAGVETVTLCPDGNFYVCPAFYSDRQIRYSIGNLKDGLNIKNPQLYKISHAPICRICDAYQCRRCIWQNKKTTLEVNTPSREQCVISHIERNASRKLLAQIREIGQFLPGKEIQEIDYYDPFDKIIQNDQD